MDIRKPTKTLADYLVIAVSPALIMVMVHSVCFFLVEVFYRGEAAGNVRWVLFWFVLAVVLIARIGIEQGTGHAMAYGLILALVTWFYLSSVQPNVFFGALLLGIVWFTAHKLTCNCTLIDDDADASGQGLLQTLWRLPQKFRTVLSSVTKAVGTSHESERRAPARPVSKQLLQRAEAVLGAPTTRFKVPMRGFETAEASQASLVPALSTKKAKAATAQIPGVWLIYFSLAALPLFGLGQTMLPAGDVAARRQGFIYLFVYLAAALGLLVTTSFLGLRRYLRQRFLVMPGNIALGWVQFGAVGAVIVLCLALLLPRPGVGEAWGTLRYHVDYQLHRASEFAARFNPHGTGPGRAGNQKSSAKQQQNKPARSGQASGVNQDQNSGANGQANQQSRPAPQQGTQQQGRGNQGKPMPNVSAAAASVYSWLKAIFWFAVVLGLAWAIFRYRAMILAMLRSIWATIRDFIASLLGLFPSSTSPSAPPKAIRPPPFKSFKNPFLTGGDRLWPPEKLITYSYEALQSWVLESEAQKGSPQTPREFCRRLGEEMPEAAEALEHLAFLYGHVAYGASVPTNCHPEYLRLLWDYMSGPRPHRFTPEEQVLST